MQPPKKSIKQKAGLAALCVSLVGGFEGVRTVVYRDPIGIPTACFGETKNIRMGMKFSMEECKSMLLQSLIEHEDGMLACTKVPLSDYRHAALLSFTYNVGVGAYCKSTLARKLNSGDIVGACQELPKWNKAGGVPWPGLTKRRNVEYDYCMRGLT